MGGAIVNDTERHQWVENDEGLYNWRRSTRLSMREFLRQHRAEIDEVIRNVIEGRKPEPPSRR